MSLTRMTLTRKRKHIQQQNVNTCVCIEMTKVFSCRSHLDPSPASPMASPSWSPTCTVQSPTAQFSAPRYVLYFAGIFSITADCQHQGRIEPPKAARGHVTSVTAKFKIALFIERRYYY